MPDLLLRDLIEIPESVHRSDFVVSLEDGITQARETMDRYVMTEQLVGCFDSALSLITSALESRSSKGAYLHGSFGSGKSHFMAVLHLLLSGDTHARSRPEFAPLLARYDGRLSGRKVLLVPFHMVGAQSMEAKVLGGYVELIRKRHPESQLPAVYLDQSLLEQAGRTRAMMGDGPFFDALGGGEDDDDGFGELAGGWDAARFDAALAAPPGDLERMALVSDFIDAFASHTTEVAGATGMGFVPFDQGLDAISQHARSLGYDAVLLFLDELILWFASRMSDPSFVTREGPKVAKLVEAAASERPAPIVSFIARQRDLRDFIGEGVPGAEASTFDHILRFWEGRFDVIELSDTNLRAIVQQRVLRPKSAGAAEELDKAFQQVFTRGGRAMDTHMTSEADRDAFRRVYPFSPALVDTLVAVSNFLQRERTALRLLVQLLVEKRDVLQVGDLVPMGDLYDVIRKGEDPFSDELKRHFVRTRNLYEQRFRPLLLAEHSLSEEAAERLPQQHPFLTDDRLVKTMLLAALVGDAGPLRNLTVRRLADLNHGTIRSPIPGQERTAVLQRLQRWAPDVPELRLVGDEQDPTVSLRISGVDVQGIIDQASSVDNAGARRRKIKELVAQALGLEDKGSLLSDPYTWVWRGSRRSVEVQFANVRNPADIPDSAFRAGDVPKVVVDYPFDENNHPPADDLARIDDEIRPRIGPTSTVAWLPAYFTEAALERLGKLVILDHLLSGDRLEGYTRALSPQDRVEARHALESMRDSHKEQVGQFLRQAYAIETPEERWIRSDLNLREQFPSLDATLTIRPPTAANMKDAFEQILDQVMRHRFPAHPEFDDEVRLGDLRTALGHVERALSAVNQRVEIPTSDRRAVRRLLGPLKIATTGDSHIVLDRYWKDHFHRKQAENPGVPTTVERLREWMDDPRPMGLDERVSNLVILSYALMDDRVLVRAGQPVAPDVQRLDSLTEVRTQALPDQAEWEEAGPRAEAIFGIPASPIRNASNVSSLVNRLKQEAAAHREAADRLVSALNGVPAPFAPSAGCDRLRTAEAAATLLRSISGALEVEVIAVLARAEIPTSPQALGRSIKSSGEVVDAIRQANWDLLQGAVGLAEPWEGRAQALKDRLTDALTRDELASGLKEVLQSESRAATHLLGEAVTKPPVAPPVPRPPPGGGTAGPPPVGPAPPPPAPVGPQEQVRQARSPGEARAILTELEESSGEIEAIEIRVRYRR